MSTTSLVHLHWNHVLESAPVKQNLPHNRVRIQTRVDEHNGARAVLDHDHDFFEIALVISGSARHRNLYGTKAARRGDVFIIPPGIWHRFVECRGLKLFNLFLGPELFHSYLPFLERDPFWSPFLTPGTVEKQPQWTRPFALPPAEMKSVTDVLEQLYAVGNRPHEFDTNFQLIGLLVQALGKLAAGLRNQSQLQMQTQALHPLIRRGIELIEGDPDRDWRASELCQQLNGVSKAYLTRLFKNQLGVTPKNYVSQRRIERAAVRLLTTSLSVTEVAIQSGWDDPNLFSRRFRQFFGVTPSAYRDAKT